MRLSMGFAGSADIFQAEMMDLMESLEYVRAYKQTSGQRRD
jgi:hypothetical protein